MNVDIYYVRSSQGDEFYMTEEEADKLFAEYDGDLSFNSCPLELYNHKEVLEELGEEELEGLIE